MAKVPPAPIDVTEFQFKAQCKLKIFDDEDSTTFAKPCNCIATSSRFSLVFVGTNKNTLEVIQLKNIESYNVKDGVIKSYMRRIVTTPSQIKFLALNSDETKLSIVIEKDNCPVALIYEVTSFLKANLNLLQEIRLSPAPGVIVLNAVWNPALPTIFTVCKSDGSLGLYDMQSTGLIISELPAMCGVTCMCWSPKGKQIAVGDKTGKITQYKPDLKAAKVINPPQLNGSPTIIALQWISNYQFVGVYTIQGNNDNSSLLVVDSPKTGDTVYTNYDDICYSYGSTRPYQFYIHHLPLWNILMVASANSMEVGVLAAVNENWRQWILSDSSRAELPLSASKNDTLPIGLAVNLGATNSLQIGENDLPPVPLLMVLSNDGVLCCFNVINLKPDAPKICITPENILDNSGLNQFTNANVTSIATPTEIKQAPQLNILNIPFAKENSKSLPITVPTVVPSDAPKIFPIAATQAAAPVTPTIFTNTFTTPVKPQLAPAFTPAIINTPKDDLKHAASITNKDSDVKRKGMEKVYAIKIREECINLEADVKTLLHKSKCVSVDIGTTNEATKIATDANNLNEFLKDVNDTCKAQSAEVHYLKQSVIQTWAWYEAAQSRFAISKDPTMQAVLRSQPLDPASIRQLSDIKHILYYINSQLVQANGALDEQWNNFQDSCKKTLKYKLPTIETIYQSMVRQNAILHKQSYILKDVGARLKCAKPNKIGESLLVSFNKADNLEDEIKKLQIDPQDVFQLHYEKIIERQSKLTSSKTEKIKKLIQGRDISHISVNKPEYVDTSEQISSFLAAPLSPINPNKNLLFEKPEIVQSTPIIPTTAKDIGKSQATKSLFVTKEIISALQTKYVSDAPANAASFDFKTTSSLPTAVTVSVVSSAQNQNVKFTSPFAAGFNLTTKSMSANVKPQTDLKASEGKNENTGSAFVPTTPQHAVTIFNAKSTSSVIPPATSSISIFGKNSAFTLPKTSSNASTKPSIVFGSPSTTTTSFSFNLSSAANQSPTTSIFTSAKPTSLVESSVGTTEITSSTPVASFISTPVAAPSVVTTGNLFSLTPKVSESEIKAPSITQKSDEKSKGFSFTTALQNLPVSGSSIFAAPTSPIFGGAKSDSIFTSIPSTNNSTATSTVPQTTTAATDLSSKVTSAFEQKPAPTLFGALTITSQQPAAVSSASTGLSIFAATTTTTTIAKTVFETPASNIVSSQSTSIFGSPVVQTTTLYTPAVTTSVNEAKATTSFFSLTTPAVPVQSGSIFGTVAPTTSASSGSIFGAITQPTSASGPIFATSSVFGDNKTPFTTSFGSSPTATTTTTTNAFSSNFGTENKSIFGTATTSSSIFSSTLTNKSPFVGNSFGNTPESTSPTTNSPFGTATASSTASPFVTSTSSSASPFGGPVSMVPPFGVAASNSGSPFGQKTVSSSTSIFNSGTTPSTSTSNSPFGVVTNTSPFEATSNAGTSPFGVAPATTSAPFGTANSPFGSTFGAQTSNVASPFGAAATTTTTPFGAATNSPFGAPTPATSPFGSTSNAFNKSFSFSAAAANIPHTTSQQGFGKASFGFGGASTDSGLSFGSLNVGNNTTTASNSGFGFGQTQPQNPFGKTSATEQKSPFSGGNLFGTPATSSNTSSIFGGSTSSPFNKATPAFGSPPAFGSQPTFGQQSTFAQPSNFGSGNVFGSPQGGAFSGANQSISQTGFGTQSSGFGAPPAFGGSPSASGFGSPATFGGAPGFGTSPTFGNMNKVFGSTGGGETFGNVAQQQPQNSTFANLANQSTLGFGSLAQQSPPATSQPSGFGGGSFSTWR